MANYSRATTIEDYYSDDDPPSHRSSTRVSPQQQSPMFRKRANSIHRDSIRNRQRNYLREYYPTDESEDEEEISRAMYELGLDNNRFGNVSRRSSYEHPPSPGYYRPYMEEEPYPPQFMVPPPHMQERYAPPPPPPPPPPPQWIPPYMMEEMSPHMAPMYPPRPTRRSASSRSYNNRPPRQRQDMFLSHDNDDQDPHFDDVSPDEEEYMYRVPLSRQSSVGSTGSRRNPRVARRASSVSSHAYFYPPPPPPPPQPMMDPRFMPSRRIHSEPNSPPSSDSESDEEPMRRMMPPPPNFRPGLGRSLSFSGGFPPPPPPPMMMIPPHPMDLQRTASMYSLPGTEFFDAVNSPNVPPSVVNSEEGKNGQPPTSSAASTTMPMLQQMPPQQMPPQQIPGQMPPQMSQQMPGQMPQQMPPQMSQQMPGQMPQQMSGQLPQQMPGQLPQPMSQQMPGQKPNQMAGQQPSQMMPGQMPQPMGQMPPWMNGFPNSPGNMMQMPMMGMFNNPMMQPMFNFMPDMWMQDPLPFPNEQQGDSPPVHEPPPDDENDMMMPPPPQSQQPPTPMLKRGLSKLGGWFGGPKFPPPPPMGHPNGGFMMDGPSKKEQKRAKEYQKLGVFYCWRIADTQDNFESFSIPNQKIIKRKIEKGQRAHILLQKEKKLPGGIIIDLQTWRGCSMGVMNKQNIVEYLEIKEQDFNTMSDFRFSNPSY